MVDLPLTSEHKFLGRQVIYTSREVINENTIPTIINGAMNRHLKNRDEIEYLYRYFRGDQPILERIKLIRPDVNNKIAINNAFSTVRNAVGYFLGEPIQFTAKRNEISSDIEKLNAYMDSENKACEDMAVGNWGSISGAGYRLISVDSPSERDEASFEIPTLDPRNTFVVYSTTVGHAAVLGVTYNDLLNDDGSVVGTKFTVYDKDYQYIYVVKGNFRNQIKPQDLRSMKPHYLGDVPIIEYPNNEWRMGDFEMVLTIFDAINKNFSDRENSVEQIVNSILVFVNCELEKAKDNPQGISGLEQLKENLAIEIKSSTGQQADIKFVNSAVNQNEAETLAQSLIDYAYAITGIPDRKSSANGSGGDTGDAVYLRDGYQALELVARTKERHFRKSERQMLRIVCRIIDIFDKIKIRPMDVDIRFVRNRTNNIVNKSQALLNFATAKVMHPTDMLAAIGITETPEDMARRGQAYWEKQVAEEELLKKQQTPKSVITEAVSEGQDAN